jgi:hypothetical protein
MALAVLGSSGNQAVYHQQPGAKWKITSSGLDTFDVEFAGVKSLLENLLNQYNAARGTALSGVPGVYLTDVDSEESRSFGYIYLRYSGLRSGTPRAPVPKDRKTIKTATFATDTPEKATRDVSYEAPETTWSYISNTYQANSRGLGVQAVAHRDAIIKRSVIIQEDGTRLTGSVSIGLIGALTRVAVETLADYTCDKIEFTPYFECSETWALEYPSDS